MKLIGHVVLLAVGIYAAYALPNLTDDVLLNMIMPRSVPMTGRALTPAEENCQRQYDNSSKAVSNSIAQQTNLCYVNYNRTSGSNNVNVNNTVREVRNLTSTLITNLQKCQNITDNERYLQCDTNNFRTNLNLLDTANIKSYQALDQIAMNRTQNEAVLQNCRNKVFDQAQVNQTINSQNYYECLKRAQNQKQMPTQLQLEQN